MMIAAYAMVAMQIWIIAVYVLVMVLMTLDVDVVYQVHLAVIILAVQL